MTMIPNLIIAGSPKSGSSSLHQLLCSHPDICMSTPKEPGLYSIHWVNREIWKTFFKDYKNQKIIGESSVGYFINETVPKRIQQLNPNTKIIFILRNPIDRTFSHYLGRQRKAREFRSFTDAIEGDKKQYLFFYSFYYLNISKFLQFIPAENIHVVIFEEYLENSRKVLSEIFYFLGVEDNLEVIPPLVNRGSRIRNLKLNLFIKKLAREARYKKNIPKILRMTGGMVIRLLNRLNRSAQRKTISDANQHYLKEIFYADVKNLEAFLGRELPWKI